MLAVRAGPDESLCVTAGTNNAASCENTHRFRALEISVIVVLCRGHRPRPIAGPALEFMSGYGSQRYADRFGVEYNVQIAAAVVQYCTKHTVLFFSWFTLHTSIAGSLSTKIAHQNRAGNYSSTSVLGLWRKWPRVGESSFSVGPHFHSRKTRGSWLLLLS